MKLLLKTIIAALVITAISCSKSTNEINHVVESKPLRIAFLNDKSMSVKDSVSADELDVLMEEVVQRGGKFIYGEMTKFAPKFYTLSIAMPPQVSEKIDRKNPFKVNIVAKKQAEEKLKNETDNYLRTRDIQFATFSNSLDHIVPNSFRSDYSDITIALEKLDAELCLQSPYSQPYDTWIIIHSDMKDDWIGAGGLRTFENFKCPSNYPIIIIGNNGAGNVGLQEGTFINVGTLSEAITYIKSKL